MLATAVKISGLSLIVVVAMVVCHGLSDGTTTEKIVALILGLVVLVGAPFSALKSITKLKH